MKTKPTQSCGKCLYGDFDVTDKTETGRVKRYASGYCRCPIPPLALPPMPHSVTIKTTRGIIYAECGTGCPTFRPIKKP